MSTNTMITITGNLADNAEVRTTTTGKATAKLRVAVNRRKRNASGTWTEETDWHNVVLWGTLAEAAADLKKGAGVIVHGRLAQRDWTTSDGQKRTVWEITAEHIGVIIKPRWDSEARSGSRDRSHGRDDNADRDRDQGRGRERELPWEEDAA
jgi:single-strand DNA-binding protein